MRNADIANILHEIAIYLEMDDIPFKPRAYERASEVIGDLSEEITHLYKSGGLNSIESLPNIGKGIAERIEELIKTGKIEDYEKLKRKIPVKINELTSIQGVGPKHIKTFYKKLGIKTLADLKKAALAGKIRKLEGFGEKSESNILKGIDFLEKSGGRFILGFIISDIEKIRDSISKLKDVKKIEIAGSIRRGKETVSDADILVVSNNPKPIMDLFVALPDVEQILAHGETKSAVKIKNGIQIDLRVVPSESYGAALNYFTGSKNHNIALRELAMTKGWKLNEYGLFRKNQKSEINPPKFCEIKLGRVKNQNLKSKPKNDFIAGKTEEELYRALGLSYIPPELREMTGEIEAALQQADSKPGGLPKLIEHGDLKGDLQVQTNWSDGKNSVSEMADKAEKIGLEYIAITDHTKRLTVTNGLDEKRITQQWKEIDETNKKSKARGSKFVVFKGTECDILPDGSLDLTNDILSKLDVVGISVHSKFNMSVQDQTERIKKAMSNPHADILFHPTGRIIQSREPYEIDIEDIIQHAKKTRTVLEIDAFPSRSDLKDEHIKKCVGAGVKMCIDSDAHDASHFDFLKFGVMLARRGWAQREDIINTSTSDEMLKMLKH